MLNGFLRLSEFVRTFGLDGTILLATTATGGLGFIRHNMTSKLALKRALEEALERLEEEEPAAGDAGAANVIQLSKACQRQ